MKNDENIVPMHASSFFSVTRDGEFHQLLQYDYYDPDGFYFKLEKDEKRFAEEIKTLWHSMQGYLEEETNKVNGELVFPEVKFCDIQFRGKREHPFILWIITFKGVFQRRINNYETITEEEELEYDCYAIWQFPLNTKILQVESKLNYDIFGNRIILWADQGMKIGGYERIQFEFF